MWSETKNNNSIYSKTHSQNSSSDSEQDKKSIPQEIDHNDTLAKSTWESLSGSDVSLHTGYPDSITAIKPSQPLNFDNKNNVNIKKLLRKIYGYQVTQAIFAFVEMGMADFLSEFQEPIHLKIIKVQFKIDYRALSRLCNFLVTAEILKFHKGHFYELTDIGKLLSSKSEFCLAGIARLHGSSRTRFYQSWQYLTWSLRNNLPTTMLRDNRSIFTDLIVDPEAFHIFNEGMESLLSIDKNYILRWHDFSKYKRIADVGSSSGGLLKAIMQQHPEIYGIFFHISVAELKKRITEPDLLKRSEFMEGNFLTTAPFEADLYILRQVLHHWDEETCYQILNNIHRNMHKNSVLMIIDSLVNEEDPTEKNVLNHRNLHMFVLMDRGRERTDKDYLRICSHLFFFIDRQDLPSELSVIMAIPRGKL